jgi:glycosyltransferase involved in cell wall biosynthesis
MAIAPCFSFGGMSRLAGTAFQCQRVLLECRILVVYQFMSMKEELLLEVENTAVILDKIVVAGTKPFVVVGIPAFNEEAMIARVILETQKYADAVVVCDDGSSDMTGVIAKRLGAYVVSHRRNLGYGASIKSLFKRARELNADVLVTLDADGQHNPKEIPKVVKPIVQGTADLVIGSRFIEACGAKEMPSYRRFGTQLITKLVNGSSKNGFSDAQSGFRAYNRQALERLSPFEDGMGASVEILLKACKHNLKICEVPSSCKYNNGDIATSTEHPLTHGISVIMSIVRFIVEEKPLTLLGIPGLLCLFAGLGFGVWMLQIYAIEHYIVTNLALASFAFIIIGFFVLSTAITLYAIARIAKKDKWPQLT